MGRKLVLSCNTITVAGLKSLEDALRASGPVHRVAVEGVRGGNLERRAAVEKECRPRTEGATAIQSGRLETVVPTPPKKPPKEGMPYAGRQARAPVAALANDLHAMRASVSFSSHIPSILVELLKCWPILRASPVAKALKPTTLNTEPSTRAEHGRHCH